MRSAWKALVLGVAASAMLCAGCERKTTKTVTVETPEKKVEIEVEKTEKK